MGSRWCRSRVKPRCLQLMRWPTTPRLRRGGGQRHRHLWRLVVPDDIVIQKLAAATDKRGRQVTLDLRHDRRNAR